MVASNSQLGSPTKTLRKGKSPTARSIISRREADYDTKLVNRFNSGDEVAFVEIMARYRGKVSAIALSHLRDHADAEEITQDTFIRAHRGLARFRGDSSLATWLHRIAFNLSRNRYKYYFCRRRHAMLSIDCAFGDDSKATFSDLIASDAPSPDREAAAGEFTHLVSTCMGKLGDHQREILRLRNKLNQSYGEIADNLQIRTGTVKSRIGRARKKLREFVAESYPELPVDSSPFAWFEPVRSAGRIERASA
jgi:RNA polymerase sigma-70 factor (ECF subfamily)